MQTLPFEMDAWNDTGRYRQMLRACEDDDGEPRCFYKVGFLSTCSHKVGSLCAISLEYMGSQEACRDPPPRTKPNLCDHLHCWYINFVQIPA